MKVKGKELMIRIDGATVALSTSCNVELTTQLIDARVKGDNGNNSIADIISMNVTCESLVGMSDNTQASYEKLLRSMIRKDTVEVSTMLAINAENSVPIGGWIPRGNNATRGFLPVKCRAYIERLITKGDKDGYATMSISLSGQGSPTPINYDSSLIAIVDKATLFIDGDNAAVSANKLILGNQAVIEGNTLKL